MSRPTSWSMRGSRPSTLSLDGQAMQQAAIEDVLRLRPDFSTAEYMSKSVLLEHTEDRELLREGLVKAGLPA